MEPEQVAGIVKSLTKAQREALIAEPGSMMAQYEAGIAEPLRLGLLRPDGLGHMLSGAGLAVRSALKENDRG